MTAAFVVRRMLTWFRPHRWRVVTSLLIVVISVPLGVVNPLLTRTVIDQGLLRGDVTLLTLLCALMVVLGIANSALAVGNVALTNSIGQRVTATLRASVYGRAQAQELDFYTEESNAEVQARLVSDIDGVDRFVTNTMQQALASSTALAAAGIAMLVLSWPLALLSFALAYVLALLNHRFAKRRQDLARQRQRHITSVLRFAAEDLNLGGIILGRTLHRTRWQRERFTDVCRQLSEITVRQRVVGATAYVITGVSFACVPPLVFWLSGTSVTGLSIGTVIVMVMLQLQLSQPIQALLQLSSGLHVSLAKFERVIEYLDMPAPMAVDGGSAVLAPSAGVSVTLRDVGHSYGAGGRTVLSGIDLELPAGSVTVVRGRTGSGKSTLGLVMAGLLRPAAGTVHVDGAGGAELRDVATIVPQHTTLFDASIRENLMFARDDVTEEDIARAIAAVRLDDLVAKLPCGLDTPIGVEGHQLSGGERQRLAVARALLARWQVLIVDEITSALDGVTSDEVYDGLRAYCQGRTLVIIAHRLPRIQPTDRVVAMEQGRIIERCRA
ncbi:ATP-binding cassette subfamily B protein [Nonomuraea polychroma]|uniref:ATP-binding cassette subfamily B protein n=1 Tax=Nonomuraea polychroma TaxID=46176 RepID=A0A438MGL3_9ACTN|nr:ABC transporter ATP-binding protein [Nonomuraea polychroma]RVX44989.1 ATP-binding cassette subfamily B protein [Nonomuraea polychroma]